MGQNDHNKGQADGSTGKFEPRHSDADHIHDQVTGGGGKTLQDNDDYRSGHEHGKSQRD